MWRRGLLPRLNYRWSSAAPAVGELQTPDLARQSFGSTIRLVEHFRCVPEIIQFSNQLSYEGAIRPLRDSGTARLKPHVIAHRVTGAVSGSKMNDEEALEVTALALAAAEQPEYAASTFGGLDARHRISRPRCEKSSGNSADMARRGSGGR